MYGFTLLKYRRQQPYIYREGVYYYEFLYKNGVAMAWVKDSDVPHLLQQRDSCCATRTPELSFSVATPAERSAWQAPETPSSYTPMGIR